MVLTAGADVSGVIIARSFCDVVLFGRGSKYQLAMAGGVVAVGAVHDIRLI